MKLNFSCNKEQGASIALAEPADRENTNCKGKLSEYVHQNYQKWLPFVRDCLGWDVNLRDLIFITGLDIANEWATVTFSQKETNAEAGFSLNDPTKVIGTATATFSHSHRSSTNIAIRFGPNSSSGVTNAIANSLHNTQRKDSSEKSNQCIFLRGYRVIEREIVPMKLVAAAQPINYDYDKDNETTPRVRVRGFNSESDSVSIGCSEQGPDSVSLSSSE